MMGAIRPFLENLRVAIKRVGRVHAELPRYMTDGAAGMDLYAALEGPRELAPGAGGGRWHMRFLGEGGIDVLIAGEIKEWETSEYARDAVRMGRKQGLIVMGHAAGEEPGMAYLVAWLGERVADVAATHVPAGDAFRYM